MSGTLGTVHRTEKFLNQNSRHCTSRIDLTMALFTLLCTLLRNRYQPDNNDNNNKDTE